MRGQGFSSFTPGGRNSEKNTMVNTAPTEAIVHVSSKVRWDVLGSSMSRGDFWCSWLFQQCSICFNALCQSRLFDRNNALRSEWSMPKQLSGESYQFSNSMFILNKSHCYHIVKSFALYPQKNSIGHFCQFPFFPEIAAARQNPAGSFARKANDEVQHMLNFRLCTFYLMMKTYCFFGVL